MRGKPDSLWLLTAEWMDCGEATCSKVTAAVGMYCIRNLQHHKSSSVLGHFSAKMFDFFSERTPGFSSSQHGHAFCSVMEMLNSTQPVEYLLDTDMDFHSAH